MKTKLATALAVASSLALLGAAEPEAPAWLYPDFVRPPVPTDPSPQKVAGSTASFTLAQVRDLFAAPDWRPGDHPAMPTVVSTGRKPAVAACGYCHYPTGMGRPENAPLAGLPADYIEAQMADFASGARKSAHSGATTAAAGGVPNMGRAQMNDFAKAATPEEIKASAAYFAALTYKPFVKVVESDTAPAVEFEAGFPVALKDKPAEPIAGRIVEVAAEQERALLRDPAASFVAYVPKGAIARGATLASTGAGTGLPCEGCHGPGLKGSPAAPPIAGRSPTYIARSLYDFHVGTRGGPTAELMQPVTADLKLEEMVALAAYVGSLEP